MFAAAADAFGILFTTLIARAPSKPCSAFLLHPARWAGGWGLQCSTLWLPPWEEAVIFFLPHGCIFPSIVASILKLSLFFHIHLAVSIIYQTRDASVWGLFQILQVCLLIECLNFTPCTRPASRSFVCTEPLGWLMVSFLSFSLL